MHRTLVYLIQESAPVTVNSPPITMPIPVPPVPSVLPVTEEQRPVMSNPFVAFGDMTAPAVPPPWMESTNVLHKILPI